MTPLKTNVIRGIKNEVARDTNRFILAKSLFASSKRSSSCRSVLNARTTINPVKLSRATRFTLSNIFWIAVNLGITITNIVPIIDMITTSASPIIHVMFALLSSTFITAPYAKIGE